MKEENVFAVWLGLHGCSKRCVKYKQLDPAAVELVAVSAAEGGAGMTNLAYALAVQTAGVRAMLLGFTDPHDTEPDLKDPALRWHPIDFATFETDITLRGVFASKDIAFLQRLYSHLHEATGFEVAALLGKVQKVTAPAK